MRRSKKLFFLGVFISGGFGVFLLWQNVNFVLSPPKEENFPPLTPETIGLPYFGFTLSVGEKRQEKIFGWFIPGQNDLCIIFVPGWRGKKEYFLSFNHQNLSPLYLLWEKGFSLCLFDPRGLGESEGSFDLGIHLDEDLTALIDFLSRWQNVRHFILFGFSAGANAAIRVAIERKEVIATIADSVFVSIFNTKKYPKVVVYLFYLLSSFKLGFGWTKKLDLSRMDLQQLSNVLLISGEKDRITPPEEAKFIFEEMKKTQEKELWIVEGADHCQAIFLYPQEYLQRVLKFLERVLARRTLFC